MLDLKLIRTEPDKVKAAIHKREMNLDDSIDAILKIDVERRAVTGKVEAKKAEQNAASKQIPAMKKAGQDTTELMAQMKVLSAEIKEYDAELGELEEKQKELMLSLPNLPDEDVVAGGKEQNVPLHYFKEKPVFDFPMKNHVDLCEAHGMIDYQRGAKIAGNGAWLYRGWGARMEWALLNYFVEEHLKDGYEFILPPHQLNYDCGYGAGQFPKFSDEVYWLDLDEDRHRNRFMLPTAETALVNMYAGEIIDESKLPMKFFAYTPCYRKEAGSARAEERGMIRGHQFNKVEMVQYAHPEHSMEAFEELVDKAASLVEKLGLHFRVSKLAAGDCSASMARTYDVELWIPSMGIYKECSSVSNANDYQARRNNTRYRDSKTGKPAYVHTLNGSGLATSRLIPAIVEQFQNEDGTVTVPEVLRKWLGGREYIGK